MVLEAQGKGPLHHLDCVFQEVQPMERLSFTWKWQADDEQSLVTVEFFEQSGGTRVRLVHSKFATEKSRDGHAWGWKACFDTLDLALKN